jgi:3-hydroxyisobutyrate dehydrogenase
MNRSEHMIGVIGIGNMGLAMALRLRDGGHAVAVRDIDPAAEAAAAAAGAEICATPAALAERCSLIIVAVVDAAQTQAVLFGENGVAAALLRRRTDAGSGSGSDTTDTTDTAGTPAVMLCPTISPQAVEAAAAGLAALGVACLDAPMSGGPVRARDGNMSLMVACDDAAFAHWQPVLAHLASRLFRVGTQPGDGARTKLVNNLLAAINLAGAAEALQLAEALGLDAARTLDVIEQSSGQSWIGTDRARRALAGDATPRAHMTLLAKDSALALAAAQGTGLALPLGHDAAAAFAQACQAGLAGADDSALWRRR